MAASRTAQYVALYRALETVERRRTPLFRDPFATRFLTPGLSRVVRAARRPVVGSLVKRYADHRAPGARTSAIGRTRIIDDVVRSSVAAGTRQLVILGAGFDCRAHRMPELADTEVFEVDRPGTQVEKRARMSGACGANLEYFAGAEGRGDGDLAEQRDVHYVPVDFLRDEVPTRLADSGWDAGRPTCFLWEGVTNYLTAAAVEGMLAWIGRTAPGGTLVFTYIHGGLLDGSVAFDGGAKMISNVQRLGEPWRFGLHPAEVAPLLSRFGLTLREDLGADDYRRRTGISDTNGYAFYRLAIADIHPIPGS